ncbi:MAG: ComEC/Rec2 family competence protein [Oscillospiraceae bacterium]|nr:ComEC/Rec2 family competence protein [Oscillospiraceae bacterium]
MRLHRPMVIIAIYMAASAVLCALGVKLFVVCVAAAAASLVFIPGFLFPPYGSRRRDMAAEAAVIIAAVILAIVVAVSFGAMEKRGESLAEEYDGTETMIEGEVYGSPEIRENREVSVIKTDLGLIELTRYGNRAEHPEIGDTVRLKVKLSAPAAAKNDHGFNEKTYLYSRRIYLTATDSGAMEIIKTGKISPRVIAGKIQSAALGRGELYLRGDALGLFGAVVFGDRRHIDYELRQKLSDAGLSHVAAVSGMHLSIIAMILMFLLSRLVGKGRLGYSAAIAGVVAFALLTGGSASVTRACIMSVIYLSSKLVYREADGLSSLSAAAILMLLFNPMIILAPAFQLSVMATLGILLFMPHWQKKLTALPRPARAAAGIILVSLAAQLGAMPFIIYQFNAFPTYFLLSNLLVVPLLGIIMAIGLLLPLIGGLPVIGLFWSRLCSWSFGYIAFVAGKISGLPGAVIPVRRPGAAVIIAYAFAVATLYVLFMKRKKPAVLLAAVTLAFACLGGVHIYKDNRRASLSFLNVGRGDCAVFCLPGGHTVMVDGGSSSYTVEDFLLGEGRSKIDAAIITSDKREHISGIAQLAAKGAIMRIYIPAVLSGSDAIKVLLTETDAKIEFYGEKTRFSIYGLRFREWAYNEGAALLAEYGEERIFFCSDGHTDWPGCTIVKTPNHGSGKYNYATEINRTLPAHAVISGPASAANKCSYLEPLTKAAADVHITGAEGTVTFELTENQ